MSKETFICTVENFCEILCSFYISNKTSWLYSYEKVTFNWRIELCHYVELSLT